jgi:adenine-specific DNA methylase
MLRWAKECLGKSSAESAPRLVAIQKRPTLLDDPAEIRLALLDFIADFANWDNSTDRDYLATARALVSAAHEALGGAPGTRPLIVDPLAGGGSIPVEALRIGGDVFASDLNPVATLLNKVALEHVPRHGQRLANEVRKWGAWLRDQAEQELAPFYPNDADGSVPLAYLWARTIRCEGPGCGAEVPLLRSLWLAKKPSRGVALQISADRKEGRVEFSVVETRRAQDVGSGTVRRGSVTCPVCGFTTKVTAVRAQLRARRGGTRDARLICVVRAYPGETGRHYRVATAVDTIVASRAAEILERRRRGHQGSISLIPEESTVEYHSFVNRGPIYGMDTWADYFTPRQALALSVFVGAVGRAREELIAATGDADLSVAVVTCLALAVDRQVDATSSLCRWHTTGEKHTGTFGRQALPMVWDFSEVAPLSRATGGFSGAVDWVAEVCERLALSYEVGGQAECASATSHPLPDDAAQAVVTDPPYYYSVQYADLSDFFYVWLRRTLGDIYPSLFESVLTPKVDEIIVQSPGHQFGTDGKNKVYYEGRMLAALKEARRVLAPTGIGVVVFAHTSTSGWEALLQALVEAGWVITGSWPIDTEMAARVLAQNRSVLASSVHLVCRPRETPEGLPRDKDVGEWREILAELPGRIHAWMPRLAEEGVVGADAIFACLGPALELFSMYGRVEKASGEAVGLREYLEHVWAAVAKEALLMIFKEADAAGLQPDARLTAMWLWTLGAYRTTAESDATQQEVDDEGDEDAEATSGAGRDPSAFALEFDAARKIAQGLGVNLEELPTTVEIRGETARLLRVSERSAFLIGTGQRAMARAEKRRGRKPRQRDLSEVPGGDDFVVETSPDGSKGPVAGATVLDRLHQAMILFGEGRADALRRFLVDEGVGTEARFWKLAQALSALYPAASDEKRWVDGVLARKKGLGV